MRIPGSTEKEKSCRCLSPPSNVSVEECKALWAGKQAGLVWELKRGG